jgi:hypothetical protein
MTSDAPTEPNIRQPALFSYDGPPTVHPSGPSRGERWRTAQNAEPDRAAARQPSNPLGSGESAGCGASAEPAPDAGGKEQRDPDDGKPEEAVDHEAEYREHQPDEQQDHNECAHAASLRRMADVRGPARGPMRQTSSRRRSRTAFPESKSVVLRLPLDAARDSPVS